MSSSSFAVDGGSSMDTSQDGEALLLPNDENIMLADDFQEDFSSLQNLDENSPGAIIFSPQDVKQVVKRSGQNQRLGRAIHRKTISNLSSKADPTLTAIEKKAEIVADNLEKIKDKDSPVECSYCGKTMMSGKTLVQHMSIHDEFKPFQCPHCPKSFSRKVQLQGHLVVHGIEKQYECPVCHQRFSRRDCVKIHMRIHDKSKCVNCQVCHKSFLTVGALNIHMRIHRGEKPFKCHLCGKCFTQKNHLITHIKRHTHIKDVHFTKKLGPRMFKCEHCTRSFIRLSDYERHVQWNHGAVADVNNVAAATRKDTNDTGVNDSMTAPTDMMKQKRRPYATKKKRNTIVMCSSSTQTDTDGGHVIIPRKYRKEFTDGEARSVLSDPLTPAAPNETPRHGDDDVYDAYDEGMDRNYSSDEEEDQQPKNTEDQESQKVLTISSQSTNVGDTAQDAAFDAMINNIPVTPPKKPVKLSHILPNSINGEEQPNERIFVIQNENNKPVVTSAEIVNSVPQDVQATEVVTSQGSFDRNTNNFEEENVEMPSSFTNRQSVSIAHSLQNLDGSKSGYHSIKGVNHPITTRPKGRPKSKPNSEIKGAAALHLIRRNLKNFISDSHDEAKIPKEKQVPEDKNEHISFVVEAVNDSNLEQAIHDQVSTGVRDTPRRKATKLHGKDFLCSNKSCKLCLPQVNSINNDGNMFIGQEMTPGTVFSADMGKIVKTNSGVKVMKTEPTEKVKIKKEYNLSEMAAEGNQKYVDIVNLLNFGGKMVSPTKQAETINLTQLNSDRPMKIVKNVTNNAASKQSEIPPTPQYIEVAADSASSIVSPPVNVQSFCIPTYSCKLCGREFRFEGKLHRHIESVHQKKNLYTNDVKPGRGMKLHYTDYNNMTVDEMLGHQQTMDNQTLYMSTIGSVIELPHGGVQQTEQMNEIMVENEGDNGEESDEPIISGAGVVGGGTQIITNPKINALISEWDDDDDMEDTSERPIVTKPQPIFSGKAEKDQQSTQQRKVITPVTKAGAFVQPTQKRWPIVTRSIQKSTTSVTDVYSSGVVLNMNKLSGILPKNELVRQDDTEQHQQSIPQYSNQQEEVDLDENSLDAKCQKLLLKLFSHDLLMECGLNKDHVSAVLGRVLQHYGVKMIEDYGQGQYEVLKYNIWRLMEWKVTIEQMEDFYKDNKSVEDMIDDIMNERVPLVHHDVIIEAQQQQVEEMIVQQQEVVEGEHVVMHHQDQMILDQTTGQHIVVQTSQQQGEQQIVIQGGEGTSAEDAAMIVQQVMGSHALSGVTQVVLAHDVSPEMLQGAHIVTLDPTTGQFISQVSADQMVLTTSHDGTTIVSGPPPQVSGASDPPIVVSEQQVMLIQQQYEHQPSSSAR